MNVVTFEQAIRVKVASSPDLYEAVQRPLYSWPGSAVVPGGVLMPIAVNAAYQTVSSEFALNSLHAHFVSATRPNPVLQFRVQTISDGGRFALRLVQAFQENKTVFHATCTFVRVSSMGKGRSMEHRVNRASPQTIDAITIDDMAPIKSSLGPWMKYQRLPLLYAGREATTSPSPPLDSLTYTSVAQLSTPMSSDDHRLHTLGIIALSDYHVLDCPPTVHGLDVGLPSIGDAAQVRRAHDFQMITSLNHSIHFHTWSGFKADDLIYVEANSPWTKDRRGEINTRMFGKDGVLIATCKQEGYYVLKDSAKL